MSLNLNHWWCLAVLLCCLQACRASGGTVVSGNTSGALSEDGATVPTDIVAQAATAAPPFGVARDPNLQAWADTATHDLYQWYFTPANSCFTDKWNLPQAFDAVTDAMRRTGGTQFTSYVSHIFKQYTAITFSPFKPPFYDDHNWMGLALSRACAQMQNVASLRSQAPAVLLKAIDELSFVQSGETFNADGSTDGIWWNGPSNGYKNTAANAPAARLGCEIYNLNQNADALAFAKRIYAHWRGVALNPNTGRVLDGYTKTGTPHTNDFTYNYGAMISAALCLHETTGISAWRDDAILMGQYVLNVLSVTIAAGTVLNEPVCGGPCTGDLSLFKGIGIRHLVELSLHDPNNAALQTMLNGSVVALGTKSIPIYTGSLSSTWQKAPPQTPEGQGPQTSGTIALNTVGTDATNQISQAPLGLRFEAEEARLVGLLGARAPAGQAVSGWGVVPFPATNANSLTFSVTIPKAGAYRLHVGYTAPDSAAQRRLQIVQAGLDVALSLPKTDDVKTMSEATYDVAQLDAGTFDVAVVAAVGASAQQGSQATINVDYLDMELLANVGQSQQTLKGATLTAPIGHIAQCDTALFTWSGAAGASSYDLVLDDTVVWSGTTTQTSLTTQALSSGPHIWYVLAKDGEHSAPSTVEHFVLAKSVSTPSGIEAKDSADGLLIQWQAPDANTLGLGQLTYQGEVRCSRLRAAQCILAAVKLADVADNSIKVTLANACSQSSAVFNASADTP